MSTGDRPCYDLAQRRAAARLTERTPNWLVIWGTGSRRFWALPLFNALPGTVISAATADDLIAQMRQAEMTAQYGQPPAGR